MVFDDPYGKEFHRQGCGREGEEGEQNILSSPAGKLLVGIISKQGRVVCWLTACVSCQITSEP